ncbi:MAG TPA: hypothetical protein GXX54_06210 [Clostridiales bacterium]|nr:hypothetical protein [Clostridiales bacterium]
MSGITQWAAALCVAAIGCTALQILAPKKGMGNIFKLIIAAFFLCVMISPLLAGRSILNLDFNDISSEISADAIQIRVAEQFKNQVTSAVKAKMEQVFKNYGIVLTKVEVNMDIRESQSIYINNVVLYLDKQSRLKAIQAKQLAEEILGIEVTVSIDGE